MVLSKSELLANNLNFLARVTKELKDDIELMKQYIFLADYWGSNVWRDVENVRIYFDEFVDDNANISDDDYEFTSVGQGNKFRPNRVRSFDHGGVFSQRENS